MLSEDVIKRLRQFVDDWRMTANLDGLELADVRVSLPCVIYDIAEMLELNPSDLLDQNTLEVITG